MTTASLLARRLPRPATAPARVPDGVRGVLALLVAAGLWGLVVVGPDLVPGASASAIVGGRFVVLGLVAGVMSRGSLRGRGWGRALRYAAAGFVGYYLLLVVGIRLAGAAPAAVVLGLTPVAYAIVGARHDRLDLRALGAPLAIVTAGLLLVHAVDLSHTAAGSVWSVVAGLAVTGASVAVWMWYGLDNGRFLRGGDVDAGAWTATVGMAAGLLSAPLLGHALLTGGVGPDVGRWALVSAVLGIGSAWLGTMAWNTAARLLPESVVGPLLVVELLAALAYAHLVAGRLPDALTALGYLLLLLGGAHSMVRVTRLRAARAV